MSSCNRGGPGSVAFPRGPDHMHDLFAVSRMHYDMAGYRSAYPPMGWADFFWLLLLALHGPILAIALVLIFGGDEALLYTRHTNPSKEHAT